MFDLRYHFVLHEDHVVVAFILVGRFDYELYLTQSVCKHFGQVLMTAHFVGKPTTYLVRRQLAVYLGMNKCKILWSGRNVIVDAGGHNIVESIQWLAEITGILLSGETKMSGHNYPSEWTIIQRPLFRRKSSLKIEIYSNLLTLATKYAGNFPTIWLVFNTRF